MESRPRRACALALARPHHHRPSTRVVRLLCAEPTLAKSEIAERFGLAPDGQLKEQLSRLVRVRVLRGLSRCAVPRLALGVRRAS
jgi:hypothetical protein